MKVTDYLEKYRIMVRSMRFFPPLKKNNKQGQKIPQQSLSLPPSSSEKLHPESGTENNKPRLDLAKYITDLIGSAVAKPTILGNYNIQQNLGDRISKINSTPVVNVETNYSQSNQQIPQTTNTEIYYTFNSVSNQDNISTEPEPVNQEPVTIEVLPEENLAILKTDTSADLDIISTESAIIDIDSDTDNLAIIRRNDQVSSLTVSPGGQIQTEDEPDEFPEEVEMSLFDHLEELRDRIFYSFIALLITASGCFLYVQDIVRLLELPAPGIKFLQLAPGEFFFVSIKVAGYTGLLLSSPFILYQIIKFVLPGLNRRERGLLGPVVLGSSVLFFSGLIFAYLVLIPASLKFLIGYGQGVVEQMWSIERYFEFILVLLFGTGLIFQIPILQILLSLLGILSSEKMLSGWRYVVVTSVIVGAVITPSTDPLTQSLLAGAVLLLYFGGSGVVKLLGK
ncbi:MAG TPA: twin-arginine translocase subunit TatC [Allocoleopsis sp.]